MNSRNRYVAALGATALAAAGGMVALTSTPATAATSTINCKVLSTIAPWTSDFNLSFSPAAPAPGQTVTVTLAFDPGPTNGPVAVGPGNGTPITPKATVALSGAATGTVQLSGAVLGDTAPGAVMPGGSMSGTFTASAGVTTATVDDILFDSPTVDTNCNAGTDPVTSPAPTSITGSVSVSNATATITSITNQVVTTHARANDVIGFDASGFINNGTGNAQLCDTDGTNCGAASTFTLAGGTGSGTLTVPTGITGAKALKLSNGAEQTLKSITILGSATITTNIAGGGTGTVVTVTGTNWDPNQAVSVGGYKAGPPFPPGATADPTVSATANASGNISTTFTVNDSSTAYIGGSKTHGAGAIFASRPFSFSGDSCTAKIGAAATGSCEVLETVTLTVTAGDLKMSKDAGNVVLSPVTLDGTAQESTGSLRDVTVKDYRGGTLGWSLTGKFTGLNGPVAIAPSKLTWTPSCTAGGNNDDTVTVGAAGAFADSATAQPLCSVVAGDLGADLVSGGDTVADAALSLDLLANQAAGNYTGTLTLTLS